VVDLRDFNWIVLFSRGKSHIAFLNFPFVAQTTILYCIVQSSSAAVTAVKTTRRLQ